jgi:hypothetical protein
MVIVSNKHVGKYYCTHKKKFLIGVGSFAAFKFWYTALFTTFTTGNDAL